MHFENVQQLFEDRIYRHQEPDEDRYKNGIRPEVTETQKRIRLTSIAESNSVQHILCKVRERRPIPPLGLHQTL